MRQNRACRCQFSFRTPGVDRISFCFSSAKETGCRTSTTLLLIFIQSARAKLCYTFFKRRSEAIDRSRGIEAHTLLRPSVLKRISENPSRIIKLFLVYASVLCIFIVWWDAVAAVVAGFGRLCPCHERDQRGEDQRLCCAYTLAEIWTIILALQPASVSHSLSWIISRSPPATPRQLNNTIFYTENTSIYTTPWKMPKFVSHHANLFLYWTKTMVLKIVRLGIFYRYIYLIYLSYKDNLLIFVATKFHFFQTNVSSKTHVIGLLASRI